MYFLINLFEHWRHFRACVQSRQGSGSVDLSTLRATVQIDGRQQDFTAQFLVRRPDGSLTYNITLDQTAEGFIGWLPYFNKRWPEAIDKLAFKAACARLDLPTPAASPEPTAELGDFLLKKARGSSFGQGVRGPFAAKASREMTCEAGEFAEAFIAGQIGKAWYWNDRLVALELRPPPTITGNGIATLAAVMRRRRMTANVSVATGMLKRRGIDWSYVPQSNESIVVDYKYGSPYYGVEMDNADRLPELKDTPLGVTLAGFGPALWSVIPADIRMGILYTVDFVVDKLSVPRLLEMNCNPTVTPVVYEVIFSALFGAPSVESRLDSSRGVQAQGVRSALRLTPNSAASPAPTPAPAPAPVAAHATGQ